MQCTVVRLATGICFESEFSFASLQLFKEPTMLRLIFLSTAAVAVLLVTSDAHAQSGSRAAVPSFSAPVQSAPAIGGSGSSFGARQTFSQPAPVYSQPAPVVSGSGTAIRSTAPSSVVTNPQPVYSQPSVVSSSSCCGSAPVIQSAPVIRSAPVVRYFLPARRCCGCRGF